jgi:hypothetical protein
MDLQQSNASEIIWGAAAIGRAMGKTTRQAFHLLETGQLKGARKVGARWVITQRALMANFDETQFERQAPDQLTYTLIARGRV